MRLYQWERSRALRQCAFWRHTLEAPALVREWQAKLAMLRRWHYR